MADKCWICLDDAAPLQRNPPPCSCVSGGWVHHACLIEYMRAPATHRHYVFDAATWTVLVTVPHGPCGVQMPITVRRVDTHAAFLNWLILLVVGLGNDTLGIELLLFVNITVTLLFALTPLCTAICLLAALCPPVSALDLRVSPLAWRSAMLVVGGASLLVHPTWTGPLLLCMWTRGMMRKLFIQWIRQFPAPAAE